MADAGAKISNNKNKILNNSSVIVQLGMLSDEDSLSIKENQTLIGVFNPMIIKKKLHLIKKIIFFIRVAAEKHQSTIYGYIVFTSNYIIRHDRVICKFEKAIPLMMTAAGTIPVAKVLVVGAGVAGLR